MERLTSDGLTPYAWLLRPVAGRARRVLDLACGSGGVTAALHAEGLHPMVIGLDRSHAELMVARSRHRVPVVEADGLALPFRDGAFDTIVASMALMVMTPLPDVLAECARVLRPGGVLCATVASPLPLRTSDLWLLGPLTARLGTPPRFPAGGELTGLRPALEAAGFDVLEDGRERFAFTVRTLDDARLLLETLYFPGTPAGRLEAAVRWLAARAADHVDGVEVATPIRRVLAMRH